MSRLRLLNAPLFFTVAFLVLAGSAAAGPEKVSPLLRKYTNPEVPGLFDGAKLAMDRVLDASGLQGASQAPPGIRVIIHGDVTRAELEALGMTITTQAGDNIFTGYLPPESVLPASNLPGMIRIEAARPLKPNLDVSSADVQVRTQVWGSSSPPYPGNAGSGVLIGSVDSGYDYKHADFRTAGGGSRFYSIWDQTAGAPPGTVWPQANLNNNTATVTDPAAHGTHVMGIAAGNGRGSGVGLAQYTYVGIAPEATLVGVKTTFIDADIIDGVSWIFTQGTALGRPTVVNLSLGGQAGPHDGTDPLEVGISNLTGPGKIVVVAAGNDRGIGIHAQGSIPVSGSPSTRAFTYTIDPYTATAGVQNDLVLFSMWYESTDNYTVSVTPPGLGAFTVTRGTFSQQNTTKGAIQIDNGTATNTGGDYEVFIALFDAISTQPPGSGTWTITFTRVVSTNTLIHGWNYYASMASRFVGGASDDYTVSTPGTANDVICVGAHTTKDSWTSIDTFPYQWSGCPCDYGSLASFSGRGPRRDGAQVPTITAPGFGVVSVKSASASPAPATALIVPGNLHFIQSGTSMSAPHAAGVAALILNVPGNGSLTPSQVKSRIQAYARTDLYTGAVPNRDWGYGKLTGKPADMTNPVATLTAPNGGQSFTAGQVTNITWNATDNFAVSLVDLYYSTDGGATFPNLIAANEAPDGTYSWTVPSVATTTARVKVVARDSNNNAGSDASNANFTIVVPDVTAPSVTVIAPNGGETFVPEAVANITWNASDTGMNAGLAPVASISGVDSVRISYSLNGGGSWTVAASGEPNDGSYSWIMPVANTDSALVRVQAWDPSHNVGSDVSNAFFSIAPATGTGPPLPSILTLVQSRPNPLSGDGATTIAFGTTREGPVTLRVFDSQGREVVVLRRGVEPAGFQTVRWDGRGFDGALVPSGIYFYRLETTEGTLNRKLMIIR